MQFPDYSRCGVNVAASILKSFGIESVHSALPQLDQLLSERPWRNIVLMLFDGMSIEALKDHTAEGGFLRTHQEAILSAVFPSTTTAATTSMISGLEPGEHGWIGWTLHFSDIGKSIDVFPNRVQFTGESAGTESVVRQRFPYQPLTDLVSFSGRGRGYIVSPFDGAHVDTLDELFSETQRLMRGQGRHYIYAYWPEPDHSMHLFGCKPTKIRDIILNIEERLCAFSSRLSEDDLVIVTADHGLVDGIPEFIEDHPHLEQMLRLPPSVEPRAAALYVRDEYLQAFPKAFQEAFGSHYLLYTQKEALESGLFGSGTYRAELPSLIGDYFAAAVGPHALYLKHEHCRLIGMHAGLTEREMNVPMIVLRGKA